MSQTYEYHKYSVGFRCPPLAFQQKIWVNRPSTIWQWIKYFFKPWPKKEQTQLGMIEEAMEKVTGINQLHCKGRE